MFLLGITLFQFFSPKLSLEEKLRQDEETEVNAQIVLQSDEESHTAKGTSGSIGSAHSKLSFTSLVLARTTFKIRRGHNEEVAQTDVGRGSNTKRKQVPEGWCRAYHPSTNKPYLWNMETRETKWED